MEQPYRLMEEKEGIYETETCMVFFVRLPDTKKEDIGLEMDDYKLEVKVKGKKKIMRSDKEIIPQRRIYPGHPQSHQICPNLHSPNH